jgi:hypothetical protein
MRKLGVTALAAALCAGLAVASARADDGDGGDLRAIPAPKPAWWSGMFASKEAAAPPAKKQPAAEVPPPPRPKANDPASIQAREENALLRRLTVCDELLAVAEQKNDEALRERVYQLEDKALEVYKQHTAAIGVFSANATTVNRPAQPAPETGRDAGRDTAPWNRREEQP